MNFTPARARSGRVHDFLVNAGKDAYAIDREVGEKLLAHSDIFRVAARTARLFLVRAVHHLAADRGVRQFVELGSGYPGAPNLHEVARAAQPQARVLYVDNDPVVVAHGRALLVDDQTDIVQADLADVDMIAAMIEAYANPLEPLAICLGFVAEFLSAPEHLVTGVVNAAPAGSYVVLSHITSEGNPATVERAARVYRNYHIAFHPRTRKEIAALLSCCELLAPGLVSPNQWHPGGKPERVRNEHRGWALPQEAESCCLAAVGQIP